MTIALTTPYKYTPHGGTEQTYGEVKIVNWDSLVEPAEDAGLTITFQYGDTVDGVWVPGAAPKETVTISDSKAQYGTDDDPESPTYGEYIETVPRGGEYTDWVVANFQLYQDVATKLYEWLRDNASVAGTV